MAGKIMGIRPHRMHKLSKEVKAKRDADILVMLDHGYSPKITAQSFGISVSCVNAVARKHRQK